jgi:CHAD domain-containing protein
LRKLALLTLGIAPSKYSSNFKVKLDPNMTTIDAVRSILNSLLDVVKLNKSGAIEGLDTEFLHNLRIAIRKSRSVLTRIKLVFPANRIRRYMNEFAWLGQVTTPVRDLDVYLLGFDAYSHSVAEKYRQGLQPLHTFLQQQRDIEQKKLISTLQSKRFDKLVADWRAFLVDPVATGFGPNARRNIFSLADEFIWKLYRKVLKEGKAIKPKTPDEDLHELRKTCKKLRYLMEFFASLYPEREFCHAIKVLKRFQALLGDFQDYSVQILMLEQFLQDMRVANGLTQDTINTTEALITTLQKKQEVARKYFSHAFRVFSSDINQAEFRLLFVDTLTKNEADKTAENMVA